jgi:hypothetical protein
MKKLNFAKRILTGLLFVNLVLSLQSFTGVNPADDIKPLVEYVGASEEFFLFKVSFTKPMEMNGKSVMIRISANNGEEIFKEVYKDTQAERIFKISKADINKLVFDINTSKQKRRFQFVLTTSYKEEVNVNIIEK